MIITAHSTMGWQESAGLFLLRASHAVALRCPLGLEASEDLNDMEVQDGWTIFNLYVRLSY